MYRIQSNTPANFLLLFSLTFSSVVNSQVEKIISKNVQEVINTNLLVVTFTYAENCLSGDHNDLIEFHNAANLPRKAELKKTKFVEINIGEDSGKNEVECIGLPELKLFRYGRELRFEGSVLEEGAEDVLEWLEKHSQPAAQIIRNEEELKLFVKRNDYSVLGYFKDKSKTRNIFWNLADMLTDYNWAEVTGDSMDRYDVDTIILNQKYGNKCLTMNASLTRNSIQRFVRRNANSSGPIFDVDENHFEKSLLENLFVFVVFYDSSCLNFQTPEYVEEGVKKSIENGMSSSGNIKFIKVNMIEVSNATKDKYGVSERCDYNEFWKNMRLVKYNIKSVEYADTVSDGMNIWHPALSTSTGFLEWLNEHTKSVVNPISSEDESRAFVDKYEVTIIGYFKNNSEPRRAFWNAADKLKDYMWGDVNDTVLDVYEKDTVIINQEFGIDRLMINDNLTVDNIESFVKTNANSTFPVPTRPPPTPAPEITTTTELTTTSTTTSTTTTTLPPTTTSIPTLPPTIPTIRPDLDEKLDNMHREHNIVFIYNKSHFGGQAHRIDLTDGCVNITGDWGQLTLSIKTFGQCVIVYGSYGCLSSPNAMDQLLLGDINVLTQHDLAIVAFHKLIRSIELCSNTKEASTKTSAASSAISGLFTPISLTFNTALIICAITTLSVIKGNQY